MEQESVGYTIDILQSFRIDIEQTSKVLFAKSIFNKSLEQVLRSHSIDFDSIVTLPPRLSFEKDKIKSLTLFQAFSENGPITMTWGNLQRGTIS